MYKCRYCNKLLKSKQGLITHENKCKLNPEYDAHKFSCRYCGKYFAFHDRLILHEESCEKNLNRIDCRTAWNKGLTKETSPIIKRNADNISNRIKNGEIIGCFGLKGCNNYGSRPEVKSKISKSMKGNSNNNPNKTGRGKKGWYKGFFCSSSYELAFVIYCLDNNIPIERCNLVYDYEYEGKHHRYYPDFIVNNTIVEIKGFFTEKVKAKTDSVIDRPIVVLYKDDLESVFEYIYSTYNKTVDKDIHELYEK